MSLVCSPYLDVEGVGIIAIYVCAVCVTGNTTGATSVFTVFEGHEVMFHVSTLLPYSSENAQQVKYCMYVCTYNIPYW